jgi:hypothetical protein
VETRFPNRTTELKLATIQFKTSTGAEFLADFWSVDGYFFSITFSRSPEAFLDDSHITITRVTITSDPMSDMPAAKEKIPKPKDSLPLWLKSEQIFPYIVEAYEPLPQAETNKRLTEAAAHLPHDYVRLISESGGLLLHNDARILAIDQVRDVVLPEATYLALTDLPDRGIVGVQKSVDDPKIYFVNFDGVATVWPGDRLLLVVTKILEARS